MMLYYEYFSEIFLNFCFWVFFGYDEKCVLQGTAKTTEAIYKRSGPQV
jgi:hypothetical protein